MLGVPGLEHVDILVQNGGWVADGRVRSEPMFSAANARAWAQRVKDMILSSNRTCDGRDWRGINPT